jgi:hypothetical protein
MVLGKIPPRKPAIATAMVVGLAAGLVVTGFAAPARAQEDTNPLNSVLGFVGMQFDKDRESIDYRARAPIVVPPRLDLPPPKQALRDPAWPKDPDILERRHSAANAQRPAPQLTPQARAELSPAELQRGQGALPTEGPPSECQAGAGTPICLYAPWKALQATLGGAAEPDVVQPGVEPTRTYLTEPPPGYRKATGTIKATMEAPKQQPDAADPGAYIRSQQHKSSVDN